MQKKVKFKNKQDLLRLLNDLSIVCQKNIR
jgi:hypothetical protein